jgi:hypothetical protein
MRSGTALSLVVALGFGLRLGQALLRWDEVALAYSAYDAPTAAALSRGDVGDALATWVGLHPPAFALLHNLFELLLPVPFCMMLTSVGLSTGAVFLVGRRSGPLAALVLATAATAIGDAGELNNYPLALFALSLALVSDRGGWAPLAAATIFAGWSHLLAGAGAIGLVLWRALVGGLERPLIPRDRLRLLSAVGLGLLPVLVGVLRVADHGSTWSQPSGELRGWIEMVAAVVGPEGLLLGLVALGGLRSGRLGALVGLSALLGASLLLGAAAAHQRPYLAFFSPIAALSIGEICRGEGRVGLRAAVVALCLLRGGRLLVDEADRGTLIVRDLQQERGVDVAQRRSLPGDVLWLVSPALQADDDRSATSPVLWRFRPWERLPRATTVVFDPLDWRYGQPREWRGRTFHTSTELEAGPFDHVAASALARGAHVWVVLYDHEPATGLIGRVLRTLRVYDPRCEREPRASGLGDDWACVIPRGPPS